MKKIVLCLFVLSFLCFGIPVHAVGKPTKVEVLYMNHGPLQETLGKIKGVFSGYGDKVTVSWYEFESTEGERFMAQKRIKQHIPLAIWIDDSPVITVGDKKVQFVGFPTGSGPASFQGKWTVDDLKAALDKATAKK
jgi:hypothetical protein